MLRKGTLVLVAMLFAGCETLPPPLPPPVEEPVEVIVEEPPVVEVQPAPEPEVPEPAPPLPFVSIVLTNSQPAYADVARALTRLFDNYEIYDLGKDDRPPMTILRVINDSNPGAVIAIGLRAARSSVAMSEHPVVFSQVFNYKHHELLQKNSRGVAALPPVEAQIAAWKEVDQSDKRIGLIIGEGHEELVTAAELAAQRHDIDLVVQVARSDRETLYIFRRMLRDVDGLWLLPDNRILSARALQEMLTEAKQRQFPVSVPSESMLSLGAMISMTTQAADIAETIAAIVRRIQEGNIDGVSPITQLSAITIKTKNDKQVVSR
ncbi:MAG: ABC transporter substrate-binding protein [Chromatiales bacterium]|nr:ABC transporter substrate-binding protein [Chromatiales bacterium]